MQQAKETPRPPPPVFLTERLFEELVTLWHQKQQIPEDLVHITEQSIFPLSLPMKALNEFRVGHWRECLNYCYGLYQYQPVLPNHFIGLMADAAQRCGRHWEMSWPLLQFAEAAVEDGNYALAMAAIKQIFMFSGDKRMLETATALQRISHVLSRVAEKLPPVKTETSRLPNNRKRIALIKSSLIDHIPASGRLATQFARYINQDEFETFIYLTQPTLASRPQELSIRFDSKPAQETGSGFLRRLKRAGVDVCPVPPDLPYHLAAHWLARQLAEDRIDIAIFHGGINAIIMHVAAQLAPVPVKLNICPGVGMYSDAIDAVVYFNPTEKNRDALFWDEAWGQQYYIEPSADPAEARRAKAIERKSINLPEDATVFGCLADRVEEQLSDTYLETVATILKETHNAYFVCAAPGDHRRAQEKLNSFGVKLHCRWMGHQVQPYRVLKTMDIYLNQFPEGGSLSVREAVACKVPVVAMRVGTSFQARAGVEFLGRNHALPTQEVDKYLARAIGWAKDTATRKKVAQAQYRRLTRQFPVRSLVDRLIDIAMSARNERS